MKNLDTTCWIIIVLTTVFILLLCNQILIPFIRTLMKVQIGGLYRHIPIPCKLNKFSEPEYFIVHGVELGGSTVWVITTHVNYPTNRIPFTEKDFFERFELVK